MIPDEVAAYYDEPERAESMCRLLMRAHPEWTVWRGEDRLWRARRDGWPEGVELSSPVAGLLNQVIAQMGDPT